MYSEARAALVGANTLMGERFLSKAENNASDVAVEILVRLEAVKRRKGWWFRTKRRIQITQMFLGVQSQFGFLISGEVNDDAVKLKAFTELALNKYGSLPRSKLGKAIHEDFDKFACNTDRYTADFQFPEVEDFLFSFDRYDEEGLARTLTVHGSGKYAGFMLQVLRGNIWQCFIGDGVRTRATCGAAKMVEVMERKFGVRNFTKFMESFR
jgi:hypothetical protein